MIDKMTYERALAVIAEVEGNTLSFLSDCSGQTLREMRELASLSRPEASELTGIGERRIVHIESLSPSKLSDMDYFEIAGLCNAYKDRFVDIAATAISCNLDDAAGALAAMRQAAGIGSYQVARENGISPTSAWCYEAGTRIPPADLYARLVSSLMAKIEKNIDYARSLFEDDIRSDLKRKASEIRSDRNRSTVKQIASIWNLDRDACIVVQPGPTEEIRAARTATSRMLAARAVAPSFARVELDLIAKQGA